MNKVLLILPPFDQQSTFKSEKQEQKNTENQIYHYPPLGLCYIATSLLEKNYEVEIIDSVAESYSFNDILEKIKIFNPQVIGISVSTYTLEVAKILIKRIKKISNSPILIGGPHTNFNPEIIKELNSDYAWKGDAAFSISNAIQKILNNTSEEIVGLVENKNGKIIDNGRAVLNDLEKIKVPSRKLLKGKYFSPLYSGKKLTTLITSWGCIYNCIFCGLPENNSYKRRSNESILAEINHCLMEGYNAIDFQDDLFTFKKEETKNLCKKIIKNNLKFAWGCATRIDCLDEELLLLMKEAGCTNIRFGIESGVSRVRKIIGKGFSNENIENGLNLVKKAGIKSTFFITFGHPTETLDEMKKSVEFTKKLKPTYAQFVLVNPLPGSRIYEIGVKEGLWNNNLWIEIANGKEYPTYVPEKVTLKQMKELQSDSYREFYMNFNYILKSFLSCRSFSDVFDKIKTGLVLLKDF